MRTKIWNNTTFTQIPDGGDVNWPLLTLFLVALADNAQTTNIQKSAIRVATTSPVNISASTDHVVVCKLSSPDLVDVTLPFGSNGQEFTIVDGVGDAGTNTISITCQGGDTINGTPQYYISSNNGCITLKYSAVGTDWKVIEGFINDFGTVTPSSVVTFTNKDYDGGTATNTRRMTMPKNTTTNLAALSRKAGTILYDTDELMAKYDDGTRVQAMGVRNAFTIENYTLVVSVATNALTIAVKTLAGNNPQPISPVRVPYRSATTTSGVYTILDLNTPESLTISSGSTLGQISGAKQDIFVYLINTSGGPALGVSSTLFDQNVTQSSTAEGGAGAADSATVLYSANAQSGKQIRLIGKLSSTQATAGTWVTLPDVTLISNTQGATALDNAEATRVGLKQYLDGTTYNNSIAPTSAGTSWTIVRGVYIPYQTLDGTWRLKFTIYGTVPSSSRTSYSITVSGITSKNVSTWFQPITTYCNAAAGTVQNGNIGANGNTMTCTHLTASATAYSFAGDIELESKPTWAY